MTKAEMEQHWRQYSGLVEQARSAEQRVEIVRAIEIAEASWDYIDGMLRHVAKQDGKADHELDGITLVLQYAPVLFNHHVLDRLEQFLAGKRRITKWASSDLDEGLVEARAFMWRAHAIWDELERQRQCNLNALRRGFTGNDAEWHRIIRTWESMHVVSILSAGNVSFVSLATRMDDTVIAKCAHCGKPARRTKAELLDAIDCGHCRRPGHFVHISDIQRIERERA
jgi:hypothetical protein